MSRITPVSAKKRKVEEAMKGKTNSRNSKPRKRVKKQREYHSSSEEDDNEDEEEEENTDFKPVSLADSENEDENVHPSRVKRARKPERKPVRVTARDAPVETALTGVGAAAVPTTATAGVAAAAPKIVKERRVKPHTSIPTSKVEEGLQGDADDDDVEEEDISSSEDGDLNLASAAASRKVQDESDSPSDLESDSGTESEAAGKPKTKSKRNDPAAFSTSISKILSTKLPSSKREDPVLSRSKSAAQTAAAVSETRLDRRAQARLRAERFAAYSRGRVTDVTGVERGVAGQVAEEEKVLRKIAQRGVVQLFNAFQAAHVRAEAARREERQKGTLGMGRREERAKEDGKAAFLAAIGGKKATASTTTEAS